MLGVEVGVGGVARLNGRTMVGVRRGRCCLCAEDGADISPACQARCFSTDLQDVCVCVVGVGDRGRRGGADGHGKEEGGAVGGGGGS